MSSDIEALGKKYLYYLSKKNYQAATYTRRRLNRLVCREQGEPTTNETHSLLMSEIPFVETGGLATRSRVIIPEIEAEDFNE